jgi:hypothetical protein
LLRHLILALTRAGDAGVGVACRPLALEVAGAVLLQRFCTGAIGITTGTTAARTSAGHTGECPVFWKRETARWALTGEALFAERSEVRSPTDRPFGCNKRGQIQ